MDEHALAYSQPMVGTPKSSDPRRDVIANQLREAIISGRFKAGERLIEDALAEEHGVSRVPVREALRRLETEGFVVLTPYRGATVSTGSGRDSLELMQVRRGLEVMAARLAAEIRGGEVAAELEAVVGRGREAAHSHQVKALPPLIMQFHELVAQASGNHQLQLAIDRVLQRVSWGFELELEERIDSAWADHAAIASAILNNSPFQAGYLMDEHIAKDERLYQQKLDHATD
jgi:DNA-binding GntR family transcriptional regulator